MIDSRRATDEAVSPGPGHDDARIVPLETISRHELADLLAHERHCWRRELDWDFAHTSGIIERSIEARGVAGFGLREGGRVVAYAYFVAGAARSHLGSVHALPEAELGRPATRLLDRCLNHLTRELPTRRVESQFLYFGTEPLASTFAAHGCRRFDREFLRGPLATVRDRLATAAEPSGIVLARFRFADLRAVAEVVRAGFAGSADAEMSDCYASLDGCVGFVEGVTLRSGCGKFDTDSSWVARRDGAMVGVILTSSVSPKAGHIVQISVDPAEQGRGTGRRLLAAACHGLAGRRATAVSLSVTTTNQRARAWYRGLGLTVAKDFTAWVWQPTA